MSNRFSAGLAGIAALGALAAMPLLAQERGAAAVLDEVVITAEDASDQPEGYRVRQSSGATRTQTPLAETPQSVSVLPATLLEDLDSPRVEKALD